MHSNNIIFLALYNGIFNSIKETSREGQTILEVISSEHAKLVAMVQHATPGPGTATIKRKSTSMFESIVNIIQTDKACGYI